MPPPDDLPLFVYGTLRPDAPHPNLSTLTRHFRPVGPATVRGRLYDLGSYPGLVLDAAGGDVRGHLVAVPTDDPSVWRRLDDYEGCRPDDPPAGLYQRVRCHARRPDGTELECWVYVFNRGTQTARLIESGCWLTR